MCATPQPYDDQTPFNNTTTAVGLASRFPVAERATAVDLVVYRTCFRTHLRLKTALACMTFFGRLPSVGLCVIRKILALAGWMVNIGGVGKQ
jgi:hypothetical protein